MIRRKFIALLAPLTLLACTAAPKEESSQIESPSMWHRLAQPNEDGAEVALSQSVSAGVEQTWWLHFKDPALTNLIDQALKNNKTIAMARERVREAKADRTVARAALLPQVTGQASLLRGNEGFETENETLFLADAELDASWDLDLFGKNQANLRAAKALLESNDAGEHAVVVGLLAEVAHNYFDFRNSERQIVLTKQNLESEQKTLDLIKAQLQGDYASGFDVNRAAAQVSTTAALIPALETQRDAALNRINVLLGVPPGTQDAALEQGGANVPPLDPTIVIAAPATVLATRPDVQQAERQFAATIAQKQAAQAALFPDISLTALVGAQHSSLFNADPWAIGGSLAQPILNWGSLQAQVKAADSRQQQAFLNYQQVVLEAMEGTENALSAYIHETARDHSLIAGVTQNLQATVMAKQQYEAGYTGLLDLLVQQRDLLDAESQQAASDANLREDLVAIYTQAGGGWDVPANLVAPVKK